jgi:hypothetical protein
MRKEFDRRGAAKAVAVAGGLLLLGGSASADEPGEATTLRGEWFNGGKVNQPCAIFQQGRVLLLINENGDMASGQLTQANQVTVLKGWKQQVVGRIREQGRVIAWQGGGNWQRR